VEIRELYQNLKEAYTSENLGLISGRIIDMFRDHKYDALRAYQKVVGEYIKYFKEIGCLYAEKDGKTYFYYPYSASDKGKVTKEGFKLFGAEDQGHYTITLHGLYLVYDAAPELGVDDDFMTAVANAVYHNSKTKNGSIQCPSADRVRPQSRKRYGVPRARFYMLQPFHDGIIDGQCHRLNAARRKAHMSNHAVRRAMLSIYYLRALRKDRTLIHLGELKAKVVLK